MENYVKKYCQNNAAGQQLVFLFPVETLFKVHAHVHTHTQITNTNTANSHIYTLSWICQFCYPGLVLQPILNPNRTSFFWAVVEELGQLKQITKIPLRMQTSISVPSQKEPPDSEVWERNCGSSSRGKMQQFLLLFNYKYILRPFYANSSVLRTGRGVLWSIEYSFTFCERKSSFLCFLLALSRKFS